jgi:hypothetical protein
VGAAEAAARAGGDGGPGEVADSYTLIPLDQPTRLAEAIREFTSAPR